MSGKLKVIDLFSGIGGFSLGLERTGGFETVAFCEIDENCQKTLKKHWPKVELCENVTRFKYRKNVDLVTAGFPCQDISHAGKGAGLSGARSGLFWYILRTACMVGRPKLLLENVAALLNRGLCVVLGALASFGYDTEWHCIPASRLGAPHKRDRIWIIAHPAGIGCKGLMSKTSLQKTYNISFKALGSRHWSSGPFKNWQKLMDKPEFRRMVNGVSSTVDVRPRLYAYGNTVFPEIPEIIGRAILESISNDR